MRVLLYIGGLAVVVVGVLIALVLTGGEDEGIPAPAVSAPPGETQPANRRYRPSAQTRRAARTTFSRWRPRSIGRNCRPSVLTVASTTG